ncbi:alpha-L-rhamnosidase [Sphingomonas koreensis]|uniref:alpha-L-rhamnosidase n=1 Tax=Sphingomonas koreensis TaxID=93064 RepID=UPI00082F4470|nr:alpha-L-rhamnosidase [Sphingomonas koreensis]PJI89328.1 alpha-L-rhamnosidase [Sphingomonas koreensis]RSU59245.1 alpha-L-rhamnosidase [Sphingomonas koreensis]RSU68285.1 alpha-L-rhamnosidase [Sphingomonas koreensis]
MRVADLRAEYTVDLLGTQVAHPRLSWRIEDAEKQISYRIRAAASQADLAAGDLLWDSGHVASDATFDIAYGGPALAAMQRVWWTVEADGVTSDPAWFEAGLLSPADWRGDWIEAEDDNGAADRAAGVNWVWGDVSLDARPHAFRIDFDAPADLVRAEVLVAGKDHLRGVWVNGVKSPLDWHFDWDTHLPFWGTLAPYEGTVTPGRNSVCALVEADTTGFFPVDGGAFAALIRLHRADGSVERITGSAFRVMPDAPEGWIDTGYDATGWAAVVPSTSWAQGDPRPSEPAMLLRTGFEVRKPVVSARLYATALGAYDARINGQKVSEAILAPEITVAKSHILYQTHDVTALIAQGENALGAVVGDGFYASPFGWRIERYGFGPAPRRFRAMLRIDYEDGTQDWVATGPDWKIATSPILKSEIYDGETFDARRIVRGWSAAGFDASGWADVRIGAAPGAKLIAQTSPLLERNGVCRAVSVSEPAPGRFVFDFGQNFPGWVRIRASGPAGTTITARFAELLNADGTADLSNLRLARATDRFTLAGTGAVESFEPHFTYHGFRYVEVEGYPGTPTADDIQGVIVHSACREVGHMTFHDAPLLQRIWNNALWSQRSNFFAVPTDCPQRDERMGWMGDIQVFLDAAAFNMEVDPFIRRFLLEARAAQRPDGAYPIVVPQPLSFPDVVTAGWSEAGIILPWQLWQRYGDTAVIDENWDAMQGWMAYVARTNPDHVWRNDRGLDLGDWLSVDAIKPDDETTPRILCATAYWAWSAELMAEMAAATGRAADADRYRALHAAIRDAYAAEFVGADGVCGNGSQTSQVLSLAFGLVPEARRAAAARVLTDEIRGRGMKLSTGFLGTPYLLDVLADAGWWDEVSGLLLQTGYPSWGYMPQQGGTTVWERWNGDTGDLSMNSYNHYAFGAVVGFFYRRLAGIAPAAPGFRRIAVRPLWLPAVGRVAARFESPVGLIATQTGGDADGLNRFTLTVPANTIAEVALPGTGWRGAPGATREEGELTRFEAGPGTYEFTR